MPVRPAGSFVRTPDGLKSAVEEKSGPRAAVRRKAGRKAQNPPADEAGTHTPTPKKERS